MWCEDRRQVRINTNNPTMESTVRNIDPNDIILPVGYRIELFISGLDEPSCMTFAPDGDLYIAESGYRSGNSRVLRVRDGRVEVVALNFISPITGLSSIEGDIYVSHKCNISVIKPDGSVRTLITGLPGNGDYGGSNVVYGNDGKMYWGQGTSTNSGVVGMDNLWIHSCPDLCDVPGGYVLLNGQNFDTPNILANIDEIVSTGAFSSFGVANHEYEVRKGVIKASGSILRANLDGSEMEMIAWGLRNPTHIAFDANYQLFAANQGFENRGSRPIINAPDEFLLIRQDVWYGWPDFAGGEPVTLPRFRPEGGVQPDFLFTNHPNIPPRPHTIFPPYSGLMGFDFNYNRSFGPYGDVYIAEAGADGTSVDGNITPYAGFGHRVSRIDLVTRGVTTFAINRSGFPATVTEEGGFEHPIDVCFGPDGALYVLDYGITTLGDPRSYLKGSGVLWRITRD